MKVVATNAHKNPIVFDCPWMFAEHEEAHLIFAHPPRQYARSENKGEVIHINIPRPNTDPGDEPEAILTVGLERTSDSSLEFYVDLSSDATESTERIYSHIIDESEGL